MGEFEQAKPLIEYIKKSRLDISIVTTFYSPSGFLNQIDNGLADIKLYLPLDTKKNVKEFFDTINPAIVFFIRYELWLNCLDYLKKRSTKLILLNATLPSRKFIRERLLRKYYKLIFNKFDKIFTIDPDMIDFLRKLKISSEISLLADTRYDRVKSKILLKSKNFDWLNKLQQGKFVLVAGSIWEPDEEIISRALKIIRNFSEFSINLTAILVPHEPNEKHINKLKKLVPNSILLSELIQYVENSEQEKLQYLSYQDIIVDSVGKLLEIYSIGNFAYIGGGFGVGIHSVIEPAGYGLPIASGPNVGNSKDANIYLEKGFLSIVNNENELVTWLISYITTPNKLMLISSEIKEFFNSQCGSTEKIFKEIADLIN